MRLHFELDKPTKPFVKSGTLIKIPLPHAARDGGIHFRCRGTSKRGVFRAKICSQARPATSCPIQMPYVFGCS